MVSLRTPYDDASAIDQSASFRSMLPWSSTTAKSTYMPTEPQLESKYKFRVDVRTCLWLSLLTVTLFFTMYLFTLIAAASLVSGAVLDRKQAISGTATVPQYFQTTPDLYAGQSQTLPNHRSQPLVLEN